MKRRQDKSQFREIVETLIFAFILALILRAFVVQAFKIPSGSMQETLLIGDHILVNKFLYLFTSPKRFDIVVFTYPWEDRFLIKRVIALPGERVEVRNRQIYVNDRLLHEPYTQYAARFRGGDFGPVVVPKRGDRVQIRRDKRLYLNGEPIALPRGLFYPGDNGRAMTGFTVFYGEWLFPDGTTLQKSTGPLTVEHDYYFTLGDNRDKSSDSRYWGFVESTRIKGHAFFIYWSWNCNGRLTYCVQWDRLGKLLQLAPAGRWAVSR